MSAAVSTHCVNLGNHSSLTVPAGTNIVIDSSAAQRIIPASQEEVHELRVKLELIEINMKVFPGFVGEILKDAFDKLTYNYDCSLQNLPVSTGSGADTGFKASSQAFLMAIRDAVRNELDSRLNFTEINQLRARVKQLEEDLQYRTQVAEKLREDYKK